MKTPSAWPEICDAAQINIDCTQDAEWIAGRLLNNTSPDAIEAARAEWLTWIRSRPSTRIGTFRL